MARAAEMPAFSTVLFLRFENITQTSSPTSTFSCFAVRLCLFTSRAAASSLTLHRDLPSALDSIHPFGHLHLFRHALCCSHRSVDRVQCIPATSEKQCRESRPGPAPSALLPAVHTPPRQGTHPNPSGLVSAIATTDSSPASCCTFPHACWSAGGMGCCG